MDSLAAIADLRHAAAILAESGDAAGVRVGERLAEYFEQAALGVTFEEALGLAALPGHLSWWALEALARRDAALRETARLYPGRRTAQVAYEISKEARRYGAAAWLIDRSRKAMPEHYVGTIRECLWRAYSSGATMPVGKRTVERILAANRQSDAA